MSHTELLILCGLAELPTHNCLHLSAVEIVCMFSSFPELEPGGRLFLCCSAFVLMKWLPESCPSTSMWRLVIGTQRKRNGVIRKLGSVWLQLKVWHLELLKAQTIKYLADLLVLFIHDMCHLLSPEIHYVVTIWSTSCQMRQLTVGHLSPFWFFHFQKPHPSQSEDLCVKTRALLKTCFSCIQN